MWPIFSLILTLPILAMIYHRNNHLEFSSAFTAYVSVLYALGLIAFTMYPMPDDPAQFCALNHKLPQLNIFMIIPELQGGLNSVLQIVMNVIFFMPMGFMLCRWARWKFWVAAPFALGCSIFIETSQLTGFWGLYPCAYRQFDVDDMLTNTVGAMIGFGIGKIYTHFVPQHMHDAISTNQSPGLVHRFVALAIDFLCATLVYFPVSLGFIVLFNRVFTPLEDGRFALFALTVDISVLPIMVWIFAALAFLLFELWIPLTHQGRTLGCMYTRTTIETRTRTSANRAWFYTLRTIVLGTMFLLLVAGNSWWWAIAFALIIFWLFAKRMPWDLIPAREKQPSSDVISQ